MFHITEKLRRNWDVCLIFGVFLVSLLLINPYLRGDGIGYYSYVASLIIDRDLDFSDEYSHIDPGNHRVYFDANGEIYKSYYTPIGKIGNKYSFGPSLFWSPFFILSHAFVSLHNAVRTGNPIPADGFSKPYLLMCAIGTAIYGFAGLFLAYSIARRMFGKSLGLISTFGIWFASSLPVSMYFLPFRSHAFSAFTCSLFVWLWFRNREARRLLDWILLGLVAGLMFTTYYVNAILMIFVIFDFVKLLRAREIRTLVAGFTLFALFFVIGSLPHFTVKYLIYGSPMAIGYEKGWHFASPRLIKTLVSSEHGLWTWTPILLIACIGFLFLVRSHKAVGLRCTATFVIFWYVIASWSSWHGQSSFGNRFFISLTPIFILGLAAGLEYLINSNILERISQKFKISIAIIVVILLIFWNFGFIFQWGTNMIPNRGPISWSTMIRNQFAAVPVRIIKMTTSYFRSRGKVIKEIETKDLEEIRKYKYKR